MICEQKYPGDDDYIAHFNYVLKAFRDHRYMTVDGKPLFLIFDPYHFKDVRHFIQLWRDLAKESGLKGIYFVAMCSATTTVKRNEDGTLSRVVPDLDSASEVYENFIKLGFDGINPMGKTAQKWCIKENIVASFEEHYKRSFPFCLR